MLSLILLVLTLLSPFCWFGVGWTEQKGLRVSLSLALSVVVNSFCVHGLLRVGYNHVSLSLV